MDTVRVQKIDEVYNKVYCDPGIAFEINEYFTFEVPGAKFMPAVRNKVWDGKIRLFNPMTCALYSGLLHYLEEFCAKRNYEVEYSSDFSAEEFSVKEANDFIDSLGIPDKFERRDYQVEAFVHAVRSRRSLMLSPTASGKSFIIYLLTRYYDCRTLIIVPTVSLVHQMAGDFIDYGYDTPEEIYKIHAGVEKGVRKQITVTTWQSIYKMDKSWFDSFDLVIGDEAHLFKAKSLTSIMTKLTNCTYKYGFTGTLDGTQTHQWVLEGLFGRVRKVTTTAQLIEEKHLSDFLIKAIILKYPDETRKMLSKANYQDELDYLVRSDARNRFIKNLALSLEGNTLLLFQFVEKHGHVLHEMIKRETNRPVYYVHGGVDGDEREDIRKIVETQTDTIIVASSGTFSTGINIRNLHNIIFGSPSKSKIRNLQSIGRGLRKSDSKSIATLYDIADDLTHGNRKNYTILHFVERMKIYNEEQFEYKIYPVNLKGA